MKNGQIIVLPDPRDLWIEILQQNLVDYNMMALLSCIKEKYGIKWARFSDSGNTSEYKIIDEKKFNYFYLKYSEHIKNF